MSRCLHFILYFQISQQLVSVLQRPKPSPYQCPDLKTWLIWTQLVMPKQESSQYFCFIWPMQCLGYTFAFSLFCGHFVERGRFLNWIHLKINKTKSVPSPKLSATKPTLNLTLCLHLSSLSQYNSIEYHVLLNHIQYLSWPGFQIPIPRVALGYFYSACLR